MIVIVTLTLTGWLCDSDYHKGQRLGYSKTT